VNNLGEDFNVRRLEYYLAELTLIHDGGQETDIPNLHLLIDAQTTTVEALGSFAIVNLEGIRFGIGVDTAFNHLDPSTYSAGHPLAPQNPSMHWGWQAGYRFVCMEGMGGAALDQNFEIHALDDRNYFQTTINTTGFLNGNDLTIALVGDYIRAMDSIEVSGGIFSHGGNNESVELLSNFRDHVFSPATSLVGRSEPVEALTPQLWPNPVAFGESLYWRLNHPKQAVVKILDLTGRVLWEGNAGQGVVDLQGFAQGSYFLKVVDAKGNVGFSKFSIQ